MSFKADSNDLLILVYVLGVTAVTINLFAYYKRVHEYNGRVLNDKGEMVTIQKYFNSQSARDLMADVVNIHIKDKLNFAMYDRQYYIMNTDSTKMLQKNFKMEPVTFQSWTFEKV